MIPLPDFPGLKQALRSIKGIGPQIDEALAGRGFRILEDLVSLMPYKYQDRRQITPVARLIDDQEALATGRITKIKEGRFPKTGRRFFEIRIEDATGRMSALWFTFPAHLRMTVKQGAEVLLFGLVQNRKGFIQMVHPEVLAWNSRRPPVPEIRAVYPEYDDLPPGALRRVMAEVRSQLAGLPTIFPRGWLAANQLTDPIIHLKTLHTPPAEGRGRLPRPVETKAWQSLAFFELFFLQLTLVRSRATQVRGNGWSGPRRSKLAQAYLDRMPFKLTADQQRVLAEILEDLARPGPMNRLLQGDVGCGKTVVALAAALSAVEEGRQAAIMVPTEVLARQHFARLEPHAEALGISVDLLLGSLTEAEKNRGRQALSDGRTRLVIGTQALFSPQVAFQDLGLAIIDEQHRFGVAQRLALRAKASQADLLVMTATPIPRSLALTLYGDLDISIIRGQPPNRLPVTTRVFAPAQRQEAYRLMARQVAMGGQAFVVAPRIEPQALENGAEDLAAAQNVYEFVSGRVLPRAKVGLVHGRLKPEEQATVMAAFRKGEIKALVATTVIEVGLDVAQATVILVEAAERFGLAQLHQLRGRVGRGGRPAHCLLVAGTDQPEATSRLDILARISDGFALAEEDLKLRGPGDQMGVKQSGLPDLVWASLPRDLPLLIRARKMAEELIAQDQTLAEPSFKLVKEIVDKLEARIQLQVADAG